MIGKILRKKLEAVRIDVDYIITGRRKRERESVQNWTKRFMTSVSGGFW